MQVHTNHVHLHAELHEDVGKGEQNPPCPATTTLRSMQDGLLLGDMQHTLTQCLPMPGNSPLEKEEKGTLKVCGDCMDVSCQREAQ